MREFEKVYAAGVRSSIDAAAAAERRYQRESRRACRSGFLAMALTLLFVGTMTYLAILAGQAGGSEVDPVPCHEPTGATP